jgi:LPXTG-motif cell wall-anchored protein
LHKRKTLKEITMHKVIGIGAATALLIALWSPTSLAQGNCGNIVFGSAITDQFPNAKDACLGVVTRDGAQFASFEARIINARGGTVEAEFKQPDGSWGNPVTFTPDPDMRVRIRGQTYRLRDLARGQELNVYLPSDRWEIAAQTDATAEFETAPTVTFAALEPAPAAPAARVATLPSTGSPLPLLALVGAFLAALGAGVVAPLRRKLERRA